MGLVVQGNVVKVDHYNKEWLKTRPQGNPTKEEIDGLAVYSLFKRLLASAKSRRKHRKIPGDNCPIIYALKGKDNLTTDISSIKKLRSSYDEIVRVKLIGLIEANESRIKQLEFKEVEFDKLQRAYGKLEGKVEVLSK